MSTVKTKAVTVVGLHLAAMFLALPSRAAERNLTKDVAVVGGASAVTGATLIYERHSKAKGLLMIGETPLWKGEKPKLMNASMFRSLAEKIEDGDTVVVRYMLTEAESRAAQIEDLKAQAQSLKAKADDLLNKIEFDQKVQGEHVSFHRLSSMGDEAGQLDLQSRAILNKAERLQNGESLERLTSRTYELDLKTSRIAEAEAFMKERLLAKNPIESVTRIPKNLASDVAKLRRSVIVGSGITAVIGLGALAFVVNQEYPGAGKALIYQPIMMTYDRVMKN